MFDTIKIIPNDTELNYTKYNKKIPNYTRLGDKISSFMQLPHVALMPNKMPDITVNYKTKCK